MRDRKNSNQTPENESCTEKETEEDSYMMRSFVWVFQSPDGRFTQTDIETHLKENWWDVMLGAIIVGRVLIKIHKWFQ